MMCQFHPGTLEPPNPWRVIGPPSGCCHSNPITCCPSTPNVGCHAAPCPCLHGNAIACCHGTKILRHFAGTWPVWTPIPVPAANPFGMMNYCRNGVTSCRSNGATGRHGNGASGCRSNATRKNVMSFSISAILGGSGSSSKDPQKKVDHTPKTIMRPWDDEVSDDPFSCSKEWRRSEEEEDADEEDLEADREDEEDEEELDVGGNGKTDLGKSSSTSDCPLDALLRMTSQTQFIDQRLSSRQTTTTIDYTSDDSGVSHQFPSPSKTNNIFHRSSHPVKKRRKTRTAFTNHQIFQLEKRFLYQKYLTPTDRDELALSLRLSNSQVITWFQNRRAKLKRDLEELKADVSAAKALGNEPSTSVLSRLDELIKANDSGLKKKDRNAGDICRPSITKAPTNKMSTSFGADEEAVSSTTVKDSSNLC